MKSSDLPCRVLDPWIPLSPQQKRATKGHSLPKRPHNLECNSAINRWKKTDRRGSTRKQQTSSVQYENSGQEKQASSSCVHEGFVVAVFIVMAKKDFKQGCNVDSKHGCVDIYRVLLLCLRAKCSTFLYILQFIFCDKKI